MKLHVLVWCVITCSHLSWYAPKLWGICQGHYDDVIMSAMASRITRLMTVYLIVYSRTDQRKHQSSASLAFVRGIHRRPVNSPHKGPVTRKMVPFDDVIMNICYWHRLALHTETEKNGRHFPDDILDAFSWKKMYKFRLRFHRSLFPRVQLPIFQQLGDKPLSEPMMTLISNSGTCISEIWLLQANRLLKLGHVIS